MIVSLIASGVVGEVGARSAVSLRLTPASQPSLCYTLKLFHLKSNLRFFLEIGENEIIKSIMYVGPHISEISIFSFFSNFCMIAIYIGNE